jgi:hypothetical protein
MDFDKVVAAAAMIVTNVGAKSAREDLEALHTTVLNEQIIRKLFWIALVYVATRDVSLSVFLGVMMGVITEVFHHNKMLYLLRHDPEQVARYFMAKRRASRAAQ